MNYREEKTLRAIRALIGDSDYEAHEGVNTGGANGIYWVEIRRRPDGLVIISNITEGAKREVESIQAPVERDMLYPLVRGRDVERWIAKPSAYIIMVQDPIKRRGIDENVMKTKYPKTYKYLNHFEDVIRKRAAFKRYFQHTGPFYSMFNVGEYTLAPFKVVWRYIAEDFTCAVLSEINDKQLGKKLIIPDHRLITVPFDNRSEAHYVCGVLNSALSRFVVKTYVVGTQISTHVLRHIRVPEFDPRDGIHKRLSELSLQVHKAAERGEEMVIREIEGEIDGLTADLWGLSDDELREIKESLEELGV